GTTSIQLTFDNTIALTDNFLRVIAESPTACSSLASSLELVKNVPAIPAVISGPTNVCEFMGQPTNAVYSIDPVLYATSYNWTVSAGATIISGQGTTSIEVSFDAGFTTGSIKVAAIANCGARAPRSLSITRLLPAAPTVINGPDVACTYIGTATEVTYSIDPVANATSYLWTLPANVNLVSGQGTTSITVTFSSGFVTSLIKVRSVANCASSGDRTLTVNGSNYGTPGVISGSTNACPFIGSATEATYTIRKVSNAASYIWTVPAGVTISSHPGGAGVNDTIINVLFDNSFVSGSAISVQADGCIPSAARTLTVTRVLSSQPGVITGINNACPYMVS
ncbi:MAG TPA: hypothetical protein PKK69_11845, partial [Ferruginibacter sp.]|nr:hypothetical protein [Ferruginibacter sp.]